MDKYKNYFANKKITVMGLGLLGRGVGDTAFLAECGAELTVTDLKSEETLRDSLNQLAVYKNISYTLGEHKEEDFRGKDMILQAAGVPFNSPYLEIARNENTEIAMSGALFARISGIPIIGVTGTRGKSTVTHMIYHTLMHATKGAPVILGGNVPSVSNLQLLKEVHEDSIAVMELDSWQLQGFEYAEISPHIAVFTNFMDDHLNYYKGDIDRYFADKANIFRYQEESGTFITTPDVFRRAQEFAKESGITIGQEVILVDESVLPEDAHLAMPGEHNRKNAALAYEALKATNLPEELIFEGLATFPGVPGRLEFLREIDGVKIYNDNNATTPTATLAGLKALGDPSTEGERYIILIMGGSDKGLDMSDLLKEIPHYCKKVIFLPGSGTDMLIKTDTNLPFEWKVCESLEGAVTAALAAGERGDIILFSPAFASFGPPPGGFKNEYDRGEQFVSCIEHLS